MCAGKHTHTHTEIKSISSFRKGSRKYISEKYRIIKKKLTHFYSFHYFIQ